MSEDHATDVSEVTCRSLSPPRPVQSAPRGHAPDSRASAPGCCCGIPTGWTPTSAAGLRLSAATSPTGRRCSPRPPILNALFWVDSPGQSDDPATAYTALGAVAARAVTVNRIPRVVFQSSIGAERRSGMGEIDGLAATEQLLDATGAAVIHLRCGYFFTNLLFDLNAVRSGRFEVLLDVDHPFAWVAPRDSAEVAAAWLLRADWTGRRVQAVHGGGSGARPSRVAVSTPSGPTVTA